MAPKVKTTNDDAQLSRFWRQDRRGDRYLDTDAIRDAALRFGPLSLAAALLLVSLISLVTTFSGRTADETFVAEAVVERQDLAHQAESTFRESYRAAVEDFSGTSAQRMDEDLTAMRDVVIAGLDSEESAELAGDTELGFSWDYWTLLSSDEEDRRYFAVAVVSSSATVPDDETEAVPPVVGEAPRREALELDREAPQTWFAAEFSSAAPGELTEIELHRVEEPARSWSGVDGDSVDDVEAITPGL